MSKAVLGQTLTTEVGDKGSYAASKTHDSVRTDLMQSDARALGRVIRMQLIAPMVVFNFGTGVSLPNFGFDAEEAEDLMALAQRDKILSEMGLELTDGYVRRRYGIPEAAGGDKVLNPHAASGGQDAQAHTLALKKKPIAGISLKT
jgi:phage gp29-like protein